MEQNKHLKNLEKNSSYCKCPSLKVLAEKEKQVKNLEQHCDELREISEFEEPRAEDLDNLLDYKNAVDAFEKNLKEYNTQVTNALKKGDLKLIVHKYNGKWKKTEINLKTLEKITEKSIITINCSNCKKQIDVLDSYETTHV